MNGRDRRKQKILEIPVSEIKSSSQIQEKSFELKNYFLAKISPEKFFMKIFEKIYSTWKILQRKPFVFFLSPIFTFKKKEEFFFPSM